MFTIDTETASLHSVAITIQYARDSSEPVIHDVWLRPIKSTMELIEEFCNNEIIGFNLSFDWVHLCKLYTMFSLFPDKDAVPEDHIEELAILEEQARFVDLCLKPKAACDLMLLARRGRYQSLMQRDPIKIRRVPTAIAYALCDELENRITFDDIYFAKSKNKKEGHWKIFDIKRSDGTINPDFKDIVLRFSASGALKTLYQHAFGEKPRHTYREVEINPKFWAKDLGYAPYALAIGSPSNWHGAWPEVISWHIGHWGYNKEAREYAADDVRYTRRLYIEHFNSPKPGDIDSNLACAVAACRWRGFAIDVPYIKGLREKAFKKTASVPTAPKQARNYISEKMDPIEKLALQASTKKIVLEEIATWEESEAGIRAQEVLDARKAIKEIEVYDKLLLANRFHASFVVIGAKSSRMSGADGLNPQGINHTLTVRRGFTFADPPNILCIGDFEGFEVTLALKVFNDQKLEAAVKSGKKVHGLMGMKLFPGKSYEDIIKTKGQSPDLYDFGKKGFFLKIYFGEAYTFNTKLGIPMEIAEQADAAFNQEYPGVKVFQDEVKERFTALTQPGGIGSRIEYRKPADYAESFLGFKRDFTLENQVIAILFAIAQNPPKSIKNAKIKVLRRDRVQTAGGAAQSALYGAAFGIQSANIRAAGNHYIQSPGADITKAVQHAIWELQPSGIYPWNIQTINVHDEIAAVVRPGLEHEVRAKVMTTVSGFKKLVPLLEIDWKTGARNWAEK